ncbi:MAG: sensor histidine kinase, partial [Chloroflexota bacterium]
RELSPEDLRLLYTVGDLLSIAIERARLFARSAELGAVEERNRLAREIHDTLAQGLAGITLQLETADAILDVGGDLSRVHDAVMQALLLARGNLEEARRSVMDLRAVPLEGRSLPEALADLVGSLKEGGISKVDLSISGENRPLSARLETGLYRIAQEAIANANRHAEARQIAIRLSFQPGQADLVIEDDGRGFNPEQVPEGRYGLIGINERVRLLGGRLSVQSSPGSGTRLEVTLPLEPARKVVQSKKVRKP